MRSAVQMEICQIAFQHLPTDPFGQLCSLIFSIDYGNRYFDNDSNGKALFFDVIVMDVMLDNDIGDLLSQYCFFSLNNCPKPFSIGFQPRNPPPPPLLPLPVPPHPLLWQMSV